MREWLVADGLGGYASGSADGIRKRRYHALLIVAAPDDERRFALVNDVELWVDGPAGAVALSSHRYAPNVVHPDGATRLADFATEPWPAWRFDLGEGLTLVQQLFAPRTTQRSAMILQWRLVGPSAAMPMRLRARPMLSGRDFHSLHRQNADFAFAPEKLSEQSWLWRPYSGVPPILMHANGDYRHEPLWFRNFLYTEERARGLDDLEDLASPGEFSWPLGGSDNRDPVLVLTVPEEWGGYESAGNIVAECQALANSERARIGSLKSRLHH